MDILIKNMEMPKDDEHGFILVFTKGLVVDFTNNKVIKAIELPPHGNLIDRDVLLDSEKMFFAEKYQGDHRTNYDTMMGYEIGNMLRYAPVVLERTT